MVGELRHLPAWAAGFSIGLGLILALWMPLGLFSGDEGVKLLQSQVLAESGWTEVAIPYPGFEADPEGAHFPLTPPFVWSQNGKWFGIYSVEYTAVAALFWKVGGLRGVFLLSWLGGALALWNLSTLARRLVGDKWGAAVVLATALGTPFLLYATTNYEHAWGCALVLAALNQLGHEEPTGRRLAVAGALLGLAASIRPELSAFPVGIAAYAGVRWGASGRTLGRLVAIGLATMAVAGLHLLLNLALFGNVHPNLNATGHPETSYEQNLTKLAAPEAPDIMLWALAAALVVGWMGWPGPRVLWNSVALVILAIVGAGAWRASSAVEPGMFTETRTLIGLFTATPLAAVGLLRGPLGGSRFKNTERGEVAGLVAAAAAFILVVVAIKLPGFWGGLELGSRYLLPAAPLLLLGAADWLRTQAPGATRVAMIAAAVALLALSVQATYLNGKGFHAIREHGAELVAAVEASQSPDVIAGRFWVPQILAPLYFEKRIHLRTSESLFFHLLALDRRRLVAVHGKFGPGRVRGVVVSRAELVLGRQVAVWELSPEAP